MHTMGTHFLLLGFVRVVSSDMGCDLPPLIAVCSRYTTQRKARPIQLQSHPARPLGMAAPLSFIM